MNGTWIILNLYVKLIGTFCCNFKVCNSVITSIFKFQAFFFLFLEQIYLITAFYVIIIFLITFINWQPNAILEGNIDIMLLTEMQALFKFSNCLPSGTKLSPGSHTASCFHVSLVSSNLKYFLFFFIFHYLDILKSPSVWVSLTFFMIKHRLCVFGKKTTEVILRPSKCSITIGTYVNKSHNRWLWLWTFG